MGEVLKKWLKYKNDPGLREETVLNLMVASSILNGYYEKIFEKFGITATQYNVLRILKGAYPEGHPRCEIDLRMIERASDITRLTDRLEAMGYVKRMKSGKDRRMSITMITKAGLNLLDRITPVIVNSHKETTRNLSDRECKLLSELLEKIYGDKIQEII